MVFQLVYIWIVFLLLLNVFTCSILYDVLIRACGLTDDCCS